MARTLLAVLSVALGVRLASAGVLTVGPGRHYDRIEAACARAVTGDSILVYPRQDGQPYERVALRVVVPDLTFLAVPGPDGRPLRLSGEGHDYSGRGPVPRAIFQFDPGADGCVLEGFELFGAHNDSHNGAGVRINQANHVTVRGCHIHDNDMGIMSNGDGTPAAAVGQRIEGCRIDHNGDARNPGFNHNLYLGGTSVILSACEVANSLTGHNVKSRAHLNWVEYCYVHDSANREFDLVDDADTAAPQSHTVLVGNIVVKAADLGGNRSVIHFGQDLGGDHDGTLVLIHNTIVTPYPTSPVIELSAPSARARMVANLVCDGGASVQDQVLVGARAGADPSRLSGSHNYLSWGFAEGLAGAAEALGGLAPAGAQPPFADPAASDYRLVRPLAGLVDAGVPPAQIALPPMPEMAERAAALLDWQYRHPAGREPRRHDGRPDVGACELAPAAGPPASGGP